MRKKIEELRNKEEGFTLVELLAVIVILGIIVAIAIPAVGSVIDRAGSDADKAERELILDAARLYTTTNADTLFETENEITILVVGEDEDEESLMSEGYLELRGESKASDYTGDKVKITKIEGSDATEDEDADATPASYKYEYEPKSSNP